MAGSLTAEPLLATPINLAVLADASFGYAPRNFEDIGGDQWGSYAAVGIKAAHRLPTHFDAFLTTSYEGAHFTANTEDDGWSHAVKVGLSIPFGGSTTAADSLNPLGTSALPYRAASWAQTLD